MKRSNIKDKIEGNEIDLSLNELSEVPVQELAEAPKATHLDLSCNKISKLPDNFATLTHLVKIDLSKNLLTELPGNIGNLCNLRELDLYGNQLINLPVSFCRLKNLKWLDLKNNPLDPKLQTVAGDCLDREQCRKCAINVVTFMQCMESEIERQKQKRLKLEREKEAARKAKEEKELEEQRKIKKAERERRKAEAKARREKMEKQEKGHNENLRNISNDHNGKSSLKEDKKSKSGFRSCATFLFILITAPILLVLSLVCSRMFNEEKDMSLDHFLITFEETRLELQETIFVWWHAFALPYLSSLQTSIQDWMKFFT